MGDRSLRDYDLESQDQNTDESIDDPLVFLAQPDSLMVTDTYARENHLGVGAKIPMSTMDGRKLFTVRGIMKSGGLTSAFGGNLAVMDVYAAQKVFGRGRKFDRIDLAVKDGASLADVKAKLQALLGPGFQVQEPSARAQQFESISRVYTLDRRTSPAYSPCSSECSSSTTRSRLPLRSGDRRSGFCALSEQRGGRFEHCSWARA